MKHDNFVIDLVKQRKVIIVARVMAGRKEFYVRHFSQGITS